MVKLPAWKSLCLGAAVAVLANAPVFAPQAQALPPWCVQWAWMNCDPLYDRGTPEWQECYAFFYQDCLNQSLSKSSAGLTKTSCLAPRQTQAQLKAA